MMTSFIRRSLRDYRDTKEIQRSVGKLLKGHRPICPNYALGWTVLTIGLVAVWLYAAVLFVRLWL